MEKSIMASGDEHKFLSYLTTMFGTTMAVSFWCRLVGRAVCPDADSTGCISGGQDVAKTGFAFALLTLAAQAHLACLLLHEKKKKKKKKNPARPPGCVSCAWVVGVSTWVSVSGMFLAYLRYGGVVAPASLEWAVFGAASAVNLAVAACIVLVIKLL